MSHTSQHAEKRIRKRTGLNKKAVAGMTKRAWKDGKKRSDFSGSIRHYLDGVKFNSENDVLVRLYAEHIFLFDAYTHSLITMWICPRGIRSKLSRMTGGKEGK